MAVAKHKAAKTADHRPTRDDILKFIAENPDRAAKRDIAKAFGLKGESRIWLKRLLADLQDEGVLEKRRKRLIRPGALPNVTVIDIESRDGDGALVARPNEWDERNGSIPRILIRTQRGKGGPAAGIGDRALARVFPSDDDGPLTYTARIMKVLDKHRDVVLGVLRENKDGTFRTEPVERKQPELIIDRQALGDGKIGDLVEVEPVRGPAQGLAKAKVVRVIGSLTSERAISMIAIHQHDIRHVFSQDVLDEAAKAKPVALKGREDWRDLPLITIDPADAKDHDDAVHAAPDTDGRNPGGHIVTVAIADVAAYVRPGSALDREALKRGNSVYFPDRVVPMLPERISNDLCSLKHGVDRAALAVRMIFDANGRKVRHSFHRIVMRSAASLAYTQTQTAIDGAPDDASGPILDTVLTPLWRAYAALETARKKREPLDLDLPERKIVLKEDGTVDRVITPERLTAHRLIEEFMIQANVAAAESLETKRQALIYRIHEPPPLAKQESLRAFLKTIGMSLARGAQLRPSQFNRMLGEVQGTDNDSLVNEVVLRTQSQAYYGPGNFGHFGLNLHRYAHFTSPIRRYADLIVHRALISAFDLGSDGLTPAEESELETMSAMISASERRAMAAERDTVDRLIAGYLASRTGDVFDGRIAGVTKVGLFVSLPQFGADGFVPVSTIGAEYYHYDEAAHALFGDRSGKGYRLGDTVEVKLLEVAPMAGSILFEMVSEPRPLPGMTRSFHKAKTGSKRGSRPQHRTGKSGSFRARKG